MIGVNYFYDYSQPACGFTSQNHTCMSNLKMNPLLCNKRVLHKNNYQFISISLKFVSLIQYLPIVGYNAIIDVALANKPT